MRVYLTPPQPSLGLERIATALKRYAPEQVVFSPFPRDVDLTIIYAIGRRDHIQRDTEKILNRGHKYAVIQVCLKSTMAPRAKDWLDIWQRAQVVWSYYDLEYAIANESDDFDDFFNSLHLINFYHSPLGADSSIFYPRLHAPRYVIATSGTNRLQESIRECILAAREVNANVFHLGRQVDWGENVYSAAGISDEKLAHEYSRCQFVSGLRRTEGFELPAAEGLLCGARPIVFDTPDYRFNYREFAEYIKEGTRAEVVEQLVELFNAGPRPVTERELMEARYWFSWERVCGEFWRRCLQ